MIFQEKLATIRGDHLAMSPVLNRRDLLCNELDKTGKGHATFDGKGHATYTGVIPQATLDLSGPANASGLANSRGALELSTLVWTNKQRLNKWHLNKLLWRWFFFLRTWRKVFRSDFGRLHETKTLRTL